MKFLSDNWQLVFGGVGTAVVAAVVGAWAKAWFDKKPKSAPLKSRGVQNISSGSNSVNVQAGRDANVGDARK